jgi:hypothetical protein
MEGEQAMEEQSRSEARFLSALLLHFARHQSEKFARQRQDVLFRKPIRAKLAIDVLGQDPHCSGISLFAHVEWLGHVFSLDAG